MILKAKVYIKNPSEAPSDVKVEEGKRGGHYYESTSTQVNDNSQSNKFNVNFDGGTEEQRNIVNLGFVKFVERFPDITNVLDKNINIKFVDKHGDNDDFYMKVFYPNIYVNKNKQISDHQIQHELAHAYVNKTKTGYDEYNEFRHDLYPDDTSYNVNEYYAYALEGLVYKLDNNKNDFNKDELWIAQKHNIDMSQKPQQENNIEIIVGNIKDKNILDSLETFAEEGEIEALSPPTQEEMENLINISGIDKNIKVVAVPYWSETVNAWTYMGDDVIYLMSNTEKLDKKVLDETRAECFKAGYDIKDMSLENRKIGTIIHEFSHIKTYHKAGITTTSEKDFDRLHFTFREYEEYIMKHFEKDQDTIFDGEVLLELIAEDGRINHNGRGNEFPHRYFYIEDIKNPQFKEERANILRKMGMI
jgi:hypothetical protein